MNPVKVRVQSGLTLLVSLSFIFTMLVQSLSKLVLWLAGGRQEFSFSPFLFAVTLLALILLAWRHFTWLEVKQGVLTIRRPFITRHLSLDHAMVYESAIPFLARIKAKEGRRFFLPLPDESISGQPARERLLTAIADQGGQVLCRGWHKPLDPDPVRDLRPRKELMFESSFLFQIFVSLLGSVLVLVILTYFLPWWASVSLALLTIYLAGTQFEAERKAFSSRWMKDSEILSPETALAEFHPVESRGAFSLRDLEGARLVRELSKDEKGRNVSRLTLVTQDGRVGVAGGWNCLSLGWDLRQSLMTAGVPLELEEVGPPETKESGGSTSSCMAGSESKEGAEG